MLFVNIKFKEEQKKSLIFYFSDNVAMLNVLLISIIVIIFETTYV